MIVLLRQQQQKKTQQTNTAGEGYPLPLPRNVPFFFLSDMELESSENSKIPDLNM